MKKYESPVADILLFLPQQNIATQAFTEPTLGDNVEVTSPPEIDEGIGDW